MRRFPRTARQRLVAAFAACTVTLVVLAVPLANAEDLKHKQKHVESSIKSADHDLEESSSRLRRTTEALDAALAKLSDAKVELNGVRTRLEAARIRDHDLRVRLEAAKTRLATAREDLIGGQAALEEQRLEVTSTVVSIYEQGDPQLLAFSSILNAQTPADLTSQMQARDAIVGRQTNAYDDLHAAEVLLQVRENEVEGAKDDVADQRLQAAEHLTTMRALHEESQAAKAKVRVLVDSSRQVRQAAHAAKTHDRAILRRLHQREARIRQQILAVARRAALRGNTGYTGDTGGFLLAPVVGPVTSPFGYRIHPIYGYWGLHDGTDFGVACGEGLRAATDGTVMSEYYSSVYGNRLYLNVGQVNGKNLTVVYNHMSGYKVGTGATVSRGDIVGYVGDTGWSTGCHLHFSVLVNGTPVDPMNWI